MSLKELNIILILVIIPFATFAQQPSVENIYMQIVSSSAKYFCSGNKNFLRCIKPSLDTASQACLAYVKEHSSKCVTENLSLTSASTKTEIDEAAITYSQCSILAMLEAERISYPEFEQCFQKNYAKSK